MKNMILENIAKACNGKYIGNEENLRTEIRGVVIDSRQMEEGYLFIPIKGERVDGHKFISAVFSQGAAAVLSEKKLEPEDFPSDNGEYPYILVDSTEQALKDIAEFYREQLSIPIVGITGSVGKTSTKEMIASVLSEKYNVLKTAGNFNNEIGLPLTLLRIREEHEVAVVEMGISDFGEMHRLARIAKPDVCVITNIGICHLENLKTRDGILKAKSEIFDFLKPDGQIVLNGEDDKLSTIEEIKGIVPVFYGYGSQNIHAENVEDYGLKGLGADIYVKMNSDTAEKAIHVDIPIPGQHNVFNAMAAVGVSLMLGMKLEEVKIGINNVETIGGRTNLIEMGKILVIDDCYNANPVSVKASLDVLSYGLARTVAVLGDMGELGEDEKHFHYEIGAYASQKKIDTLFCAGDLSREIARGACDGGWCEVLYFESKDDMIPHLLEYLQENDTVLVKASHFMEFPKVVEAIRKKYGIS